MGSHINMGHLGSLGQKVIFTKKASSPSDYVGLLRDSCICSSLTSSTKVTVLKIHLGSFGVPGVKMSFSLKCYISFILHSMTIRLIHVDQLDIILHVNLRSFDFLPAGYAVCVGKRF